MHPDEFSDREDTVESEESDSDSLAALKAAAAQCTRFYREEWKHNKAFRTGTLSLDEYRGHWRSHVDDPFPDDRGRVWDDLYARISEWGSLDEDYHLSDFNPGDRTLYLYVQKPELLDWPLIKRVQNWLNQPELSRYRVFLDTELEDEAVVVVYPAAVRVGTAFGDDLDVALQMIRGQMAKRLREKQERDWED